jgi:cation diffusion facilitator CzcD-associated flavoprotein CzcO
MSGHQAVVIGAGPSGVAAAVSLRDRGLHPLLMDRADEVGASWRGRYDRLKLNTPRDCSHLPDRPYPKGTPIYPTRADIAEHLKRHAHEDGIELWLGTEVHRIDKRSGGWRLQTSRGDVDTRQVVVATGYEHTPFIPDWPGKDGFIGELLHSANYRNPTSYLGKRVLVVGGGSSGFEIVTDVATGGAAKAWLSLRTPPNILPLCGTGESTGDFHHETRLPGATPARRPVVEAGPPDQLRGLDRIRPAGSGGRSLRQGGAHRQGSCHCRPEGDRRDPGSLSRSSGRNRGVRRQHRVPAGGRSDRA